ncbi:MAG: hypothetical protein ACXVAY_05675 [Mucilaginibacter sp.]
MKLSICLLFLFSSLSSFSQKSGNKARIEKTITDFLKWYKIEEADTSQKNYSIAKGGYPDTTTDFRIDSPGLEKYLAHFRSTGFVSETYLNYLRDYFTEIDQRLKEDTTHRKEMLKVDGLDTDWILNTFEPDAILDHIEEGRFDKIEVLYNKAMARFRISKSLQLLFTLTRYKNHWMIDYIGYDASYKYSFARQ